MMTAADEGVGRYKLEDGHFELKKKSRRNRQLRQAIKQIRSAKKKLEKSSIKEFEEKAKNLMQSSSQNLMFLLTYR